MIFSHIGNAAIISMLMHNSYMHRQPYYQNPALKKKDKVKDEE